MKKDFCERLRELRGPLSQGNFAQSIGIKQTTYSAWETGRSEPPIDMICAISAKFMVTSDWLLGLDGQPPQTTADTPRPTAGANCNTCKYKRLAEALKAVQAD